VSGSQVALTLPEPAQEIELVDGDVVDVLADASVDVRSSPLPAAQPHRAWRSAICSPRPSGSPPGPRRPAPRRQYAAIFRAFGDWLAAQLGRPPTVGDLDVDVIAAYGRHLATAGGRGGRPAAPATVRVYLSMIRALARDLWARRRRRGADPPPRARTARDADRHGLTRTCSAFPTGAR
jgi:hypothetical protein